MNRFLIVILALGLTLGRVPLAAGPENTAVAPAAAPHGDLTTLAAPPEGWRTLGAVTTVAGEALFNVINGGAEMYLQTGFQQAVFGSFENPEGLAVHLEIYEMVDPAAARSIFDQKAGPSGRKIPLGQEARLEAYYLNFWRGRFQVTISGYEATPETVAAIREVAKLVDKRLPDG